MYDEWDEFIGILANAISKYIDEMELDTLPDPEPINVIIYVKILSKPIRDNRIILKVMLCLKKRLRFTYILEFLRVFK